MWGRGRRCSWMYIIIASPSADYINHAPLHRRLPYNSSLTTSHDYKPNHFLAMPHTTSAVGSLVSSVTDIVTSIFAAVFGLLRTVFALGEDVFKGAWVIVSTALESVISVVTHLLSAVVDLVSGLVKVRRGNISLEARVADNNFQAVVDLVGGAVGFVAANFVVLAIAGAAYYVYQQRAGSRRTTGTTSTRKVQ